MHVLCKLHVISCWWFYFEIGAYFIYFSIWCDCKLKIIIIIHASWQLYENWVLECVEGMLCFMCYNMLVLMVDLWFKNLQLIIYFMGFETFTHIVTMYDHEVSMPLLMIVYNKLTPIAFVIIYFNVIVAPAFNVFEALILSKDTTMGLSNAKL